MLPRLLRPRDRFCYAEIFYAGGTVARDVSSAALAADLPARIGCAVARDHAAVVEWVAAEARPGDTVLLMGARDPRLPALARRSSPRSAAGAAVAVSGGGTEVGASAGKATGKCEAYVGSRPGRKRRPALISFESTVRALAFAEVGDGRHAGPPPARAERGPAPSEPSAPTLWRSSNAYLVTCKGARRTAPAPTGGRRREGLGGLPRRRFPLEPPAGTVIRGGGVVPLERFAEQARGTFRQGGKALDDRGDGIRRKSRAGTACPACPVSDVAGDIFPHDPGLVVPVGQRDQRERSDSCGSTRHSARLESSPQLRAQQDQEQRHDDHVHVRVEPEGVNPYAASYSQSRRSAESSRSSTSRITATAARRAHRSRAPRAAPRSRSTISSVQSVATVVSSANPGARTPRR